MNGDILSDRSFSSDTIYQLDGFVYVKNNATLHIEAGTIVQGYIDDQGSNSIGALVITRDGYIDARGHACAPIVFTSAQEAGQRAAGDWGGLIILGEARINDGINLGSYFVNTVEGGLTGDAADRQYGGSNDRDSSGILQYVRIEFAGASTSPKDHINALTLAGVGDRTIIDHIMVSYSGNDGLQTFWGKWNGSHLIALGNAEDGIDFDLGYRGILQFGLVYKVAGIASTAQSDGLQSINNISSPNLLPRTSPVLSNFTQIGPKASGTPSPDHQAAIRLGRGAWTSIHNSVFTDHVNGLFIDGDESFAGWNVGLELKGNVLAGMDNDYKAAGAHSAGAIDTLWSNDNTNFANTAALGLAPDYNVVNDPGLLPQGGSTLLTGADWDFTQNEDFLKVNYRGAFGDADWTSDWSQWNPQNADYEFGIGRNLDGLTVSLPGNYRAILNWNGASSTTYNVFFRMVGNSTWTKVNSNNPNKLIRNLEPGDYECYVSRAAGKTPSCVETFSVVCEDFSYSVNVFQINDATDGKVFIFGVNGGRRLWDFGLYDANDTTWRNNRYSNRFRQLEPGDYGTIVRDAYGCYSSQIDTVTINPIDSSVLPFLTTVQNLGGGTLRPVWTVEDTSNIDRYQIRGRDVTAGGTGTLYGAYIAVGSGITTYDITGLPPARYRIDVRARTNGTFAGAVYSNFRERIVSGSTKRDASNADAQGIGNQIIPSAYPSPTTDKLFVRAEVGAELFLTDLNGRILLSNIAQEDATIFNLSHLSSGVYLIRIAQPNGEILTERIIKE